jgi:alginate O-acetyltransferase complex protein AlgI
MLFNSFAFLLFFPAVTLLYFVLPFRIRWAWLLAASCFFYMFFKPEYILILFGTIFIDYFAGIGIEKTRNKKNKKYLLIVSLIANIGVLAVFKYFNFLNGNITGLLGLFGATNPIPFLEILLPIGLSFHTFQAMSYTIEVYRGNQKAEKHFGIYALYVMFYPQLVAGPIERPQNVLQQFRTKHDFSYENATEGLKLMAWGFFKKLVIADRLSLMVNEVYDHPSNYTGVSLILASVFFSFQIYCDFSGYSDIALGTARFMGFNLMENFNLPYYAQSFSDFWRRWHISLSTWFKDYLYIPLGGNRRGTSRTLFNLFIVFLISGIWHGASWTFVVWGALHGMFLIVEYLIVRSNSGNKRFNGFALTKFLKWLLVFSLVTMAWVFFRAPDFKTAWYIISHYFSDVPSQFYTLMHHPETINSIVYLGQGQDVFIVAIAALLFMEAVQLFKRKKGNFYFFQDRPAVVRWGFYFALTFVIYSFGLFHNNSEFIYFQF